AGAWGEAAQATRLVGGKGASAGNDGDGAIDVLGSALDQLFALFLTERAVRAGAAENSDAVHTILDLPVEMWLHAIEVDRCSIVTRGRRGEGENASQSFLGHSSLPAGSKPLLGFRLGPVRVPWIQFEQAS